MDIAWAVDSVGQSAGLTVAHYVRISYAGGTNAEIDAFAVVPEPAALVLLVVGAIPVRRKRPRGATASG